MTTFGTTKRCIYLIACKWYISHLYHKSFRLCLFWALHEILIDVRAIVFGIIVITLSYIKDGVANEPEMAHRLQTDFGTGLNFICIPGLIRWRINIQDVASCEASCIAQAKNVYVRWITRVLLNYISGWLFSLSVNHWIKLYVYHHMSNAIDLTPSYANMPPWTRPWSLQIMACRPFGAKPLSELMATNF